MKRFLFTIIFISLHFTQLLYGQQKGEHKLEKPEAEVYFEVKGKITDDENFIPISKVNIEILGGAYTTSNDIGAFKIRAKVGDELIIKSDDFETVYHTIKNNDRIVVRVQKAENDDLLSKNSVSRSINNFGKYIDSSRVFLKEDASKSIKYVTQALESVPSGNPSKLQNKMAYEVLGDINSYWGQADLAAVNYKRSLTALKSNSVSIKLAEAFREDKNYQESIATYTALLKNKLSNYQEVQVYEGLGDAYKAIDNPVKSIFNYQKALDIATKYSITPKITDLNSKIAETYADSGSKDEAKEYFSNSLELSRKENRKRSVKEKSKVADFYNNNRDFEKEIELRNEAIEDLNTLEESEEAFAPLNTGALSVQGQNYKIANAYVAQQKYEDAIPFFEKSIIEADAREDLVVKKDATRKLSELYRDIGAYDKAADGYERYGAVVDELYVKKEQEIYQAARLSKQMALRQNRITSLENERELNESRYKLALENESLIQKNSLIQKWVIGSLVLIAILLSWVLYTQFKNIKNQRYTNNQLALKSLRTQMNPHFIFNALNSVNSFISSNDERAANRYLSEFSQLMRSVLENSEENFIPLSKEIELLELYTKLEHFRFQDKFEYHIHVDELIDLNEFVIPPMLLQPYVENAVWHGLRYKETKGTLTIDFKKTGVDTVMITITDDGIGREKSKLMKTENQKKQKSKGMGNIKKRIAILNEMYTDKVDVIVSDATNIIETPGTQVKLYLKKD